MTNLAYQQNNVEVLPINYIYDYYKSFLATKSENTAKNYDCDIKMFFEVIYNKEPKYVTIEDIEGTKTIHATRYYTYLVHEKNFKNATVKRKIESVKSFFNFLKADFKNVNIHIFDNLVLDNEANDREGWANIKWHEAEMMWNYALEQQMEGNQMGMLIKLACVTSIRLEALLTLTWENNFFQKDERGVLVNYIDVIDKKKKHKKAISEEFYNELREKLNKEGKLFPNLHKHKVGKYIKVIVNDLGFDKRKKYSFHSLKKCGVNRVLEKTGNIYKAKEQGNHSSIATTEGYYVEVTEDLTQQASYMLDKEIDITKELDGLSKEELVRAIMQMSDSAKFELLRIINKG
jgi:integrase